MKYTRALSELFGEFVTRKAYFEPAIPINVLWERAVALTIVCRSFGGSQALGDDGPPLFECTAALSVKITEDAEHLNDPHENELVLSPPNCEGRPAGRLITRGRVVYLQMEIAMSDEATFLDVVAKTVVFCIVEQLRCPCTRDITFAEVRIVMYLWGSLPLLDQAMLSAAVQHFVDKAHREGDHALSSMSEEEIAELKKDIDSFVSVHFANIVLLGIEKLDRWLIPSLRPIPRIVAAAEGKH